MIISWSLGAKFKGVTDGMSKIKPLSTSVIELILFNDISFDFQTFFDNLFQDPIRTPQGLDRNIMA